MTKKNPHYFTSPDHSPQKLKKHFISVRNQTLSLQTSPNVFSPNGLDKGTRILLDNLILPDPTEDLTLLDLGAGYGPICIWLFKEYALKHQLNPQHPPIPTIYASEVNERAIWLLNRNIISNDCKAIHILKGDFLSHFETLKSNHVRFDAVYTNPPLKMGHDIMLKLFETSMNLLKAHGIIQYVHKKKLGAPGFLKKLQALKPHWVMDTIKKKSGYHVIVLSPHELPIDTSSDISGYF